MIKIEFQQKSFLDALYQNIQKKLLWHRKG